MSEKTNHTRRGSSALSERLAADLEALANLPDDATVDECAVAMMLSCSKRHVRRMAEEDTLPQPLRIGRLRRWHLGAIRQLIKSGSLEQPLQPHELLRAMIHARKEGDRSAEQAAAERLHRLGLPIRFGLETEGQ